MKNLYSIDLCSDYTLQVFQRILATLARSRVDVERLNMQAIINENVMNFNVTVMVEKNLLDRILKQFCKIVELQKVSVCLASEYNSEKKEVLLCQN